VSVFLIGVSFYFEFLFIYVRAIGMTSCFSFTGTLVALLLLWGAINTPLVYVGSYFGFKTTPPETPVRTNKIPRQVPPQPWYMSPWFSALVGGVLPFGAVFIELFFILTSMWLHQTYYIFGILFLVYVILVLTCAEITIVLCYFQLCGEDYRWWWRSFFTSGSSALYGEFIYLFISVWAMSLTSCFVLQCFCTARFISPRNWTSPGRFPRSCTFATWACCRWVS
tara:strand:+ start:41 stop:712 length:672 start_codon:yes stop_codon:yes gene_type:complete